MKTLFLVFMTSCIFYPFETFQIIHAGSFHQEEFYPDGYYFPNKKINSNNWEFDWLSVFIAPGTNQKNSVSVRFTNRNTSKWIDITAQDFKISHDTTYVHFKNRNLGQMMILGHFVCAKAPSDDKNVEAMKTIVFVGRMEINDSINPIYFIWSEGD